MTAQWDPPEWSSVFGGSAEEVAPVLEALRSADIPCEHFPPHPALEEAPFESTRHVVGVPFDRRRDAQQVLDAMEEARVNALLPDARGDLLRIVTSVVIFAAAAAAFGPWVAAAVTLLQLLVSALLRAGEREN